jgi:hypothetical protein
MQCKVIFVSQIWGISVSIGTRLWARPEFDSWQGQRFFCLLPCSDWFWGLPNLLSSGLGSLSQGVKWLESVPDHSPPSSAKIKNPSSYTSSFLYVFKAW